MNKLNFLLGVLFFVLVVSCSNEQGSVVVENSTNVDTAATVIKANQVFYSIPSPLQMATLLKKSGAKYNVNYLNPIDNISKYTSSSDMALNLGVYGTDMSLASIFNQAQETMLYMKRVNSLAKSLAISNAFDETIAMRLEANTDNRDSVLLIISEAYWEADSRLKDENRASVSALILAGGWVEGLYIASKIAGETRNEAVLKRIAEQKLSLNNLIGLLESYPNDESIGNIVTLLKELKKVYEPIKASSDNPVAKTDPQTKITTISSSGTVSALTPEQLGEISPKIEYIRNSIIN